MLPFKNAILNNFIKITYELKLLIAVGGIYTVIRSKAPAAVDVLGNKYCMIGMYNDLQCKTEVEMMEPEDPPMKGAVQALRDSGVEVCNLIGSFKFLFSSSLFSHCCFIVSPWKVFWFVLPHPPAISIHTLL